MEQAIFIGITCFLTGYIPSVSTEVVLAGVGLTISKPAIIPLALIGAISQTIAKSHLYLLAHKVIPYLKFKSKRKLIKLKRQYKNKQKLSHSIIFVSSLTGLPPYYFINLLCGLMDSGLTNFALIGCMGMFIRFTACLALPHLFLN